MPTARLRSSPLAKMLVSSEGEAGTNAAAPTPCNTRARTRTQGDGDRPPSRDETPNRASPARNNLRRPHRSAARPQRSRRPPKARQQEERESFVPRRTYYGCRGASSLSHTARQVSSLSSSIANSNIRLATRARSAAKTDLRGTKRAIRRSSASARILAFLSRVSSTENHSFTAQISSLAYLMRLLAKAVIILPDEKHFSISARHLASPGGSSAGRPACA